MNNAEPAPPEHGSNSPLPDIPIREAEDLIHVLNEDKRLIDDEIAQIQRYLADAYRRLEAKDSQIATLKWMVSPLKRFPAELLSKVFEEYTAELKSDQPPWILGHICLRWREVALTTPRAWQKIVVRLPDSFPTYSNFDREKTLFLRAGKGLISCKLFLRRPSSSVFYFLPEFIRYANRLRHLSLSSAASFLPLLKLPPGTLSALETLSLNTFSQREQTVSEITYAGERAGYDAITLFKDASQLHHVTIDTDSYVRWIDPNILPLQLPWNQLTHLLLSPHLNISCDPLSTVLHLCSSLAQCRFAIPEDDSDQLASMIKLQHLEALELTHGHTAEHASKFLQSLLVPSLKRLILSSPDAKAVLWPLDDIADLIVRSGCEIEVFHARSSIGHHPVLGLLNKMPCVSELLIQGIGILPVVLGRMAHEDFLLNLKYIECRTYVVLDITYDEIVDALGERGFMEASSDSGVPLSARVITNGEMAITERQLEDFQRNWLQVTFEQVSNSGPLYETECELCEPPVWSS